MKQLFLFMMIFKNKTKRKFYKEILRENSTRSRFIFYFYFFKLFYINLKDVLFFQ
jgi:hypothetical protein